jgi:hypothetical protein
MPSGWTPTRTQSITGTAAYKNENISQGLSLFFTLLNSVNPPFFLSFSDPTLWMMADCGLVLLFAQKPGFWLLNLTFDLVMVISYKLLLRMDFRLDGRGSVSSE